MSYLLQAKRPEPKAPIITIVGFPGVGKTSLAALFPNPVFIHTDFNAQTVFESWPDDRKPFFMPEIPNARVKTNVKPSVVIMDQLRELVIEEHPFKTVVFDTVSTMNLKIENEVVEFDPMDAQNIADASGGFHKGYKTSARIHSKIREACEHIRAKGIAVVFLCHTGTHKIKNRPDAQEYTTFGLDMHQDSRAFYVNHSDAVLYLKSVEIITGVSTDKKGNVVKAGKIKNTGDRVLITSSDSTIGYTDAKNCYGMPQELEVEPATNPILEFIPFFNKGAKK